ncbi:MAG: hypothetical protein JRG83_11645 [Deltaproteobacteria bacterium]|nr:hypothetical protein [Deltaproteobacteria bacterium]
MHNRTHGRSIAVAAALAFTLVLAAPPPATSQEYGNQAFKCHLDLWKSFKPENFTEKFVGKCLIDYEKRKLFLGGQKGKALPDALYKTSELCQTFLCKALGLFDAAVTDGNCKPEDFRALGHFDEDVVGAGLNAQLVTMGALRHGLERAALVNPDLWEILAEVATSSPDMALAPVTCDLCDDLRNGFVSYPNAAGPCQQYACNQSGSITVQLEVLTIAQSVTDTSSMTLCQWAPLMGNDIAIFGGPARSVSDFGGLFTCASTLETRGFISSGGLAAGDVETCQDHLVGNCSVTDNIPCGHDSHCPATETCTDVDECITTGVNGAFSPTQCDLPAVEGYCSTDIGTACARDSQCSPLVCSLTTNLACEDASDCPAAETCEPNSCVLTGSCAITTATSCLGDIDCPGETCNRSGSCSVTTATSCLSAGDCPGAETCDGAVVFTGGLCERTVNGSAVAGASMLSQRSLAQLVVPGANGPDGVPCTLDDTAAPASPARILLTTSNSDSTMFNVDTTPGSASIPQLTGVPFGLTPAHPSPASPARDGYCSLTTGTGCLTDAGCPATEVCFGSIEGGHLGGSWVGGSIRLSDISLLQGDTLLSTNIQCSSP